MLISRRVILFGALIAGLSACSDTREWIHEKYTGERTGDPVEGARRYPARNSELMKPKPIVPAATAMAEAPPVAKRAENLAPYDQYDANGNDVERTNYLNEWFGDKPERTPSPGRKAFKGLVANAAVQEQDATEPAMLRRREISPVEPTPQVEPMVPDEENGVFLPDDSEHTENREPTSLQVAELQPSAGGKVDDAYPHLSSVPKPPAQFQELKKEKGPTEQELQMNHDSAMEQKKMLNEEPTELPPATLPRVEGLLREIDSAIHRPTPIIQAAR